MSGTAAATALAAAHLRARLRPLHAALRLAVDRQTAQNARLTRPDLTPFCVSAQEADLLLERTGAGLDRLGGSPPRAPAEDPGAERELRQSAAASSMVLPLDDLARRFRLARAEQDALLLAMAPELDRGWERAYAYVVDDLNRRLPSIELIVTVLSAAGSDPAEVAPAAWPGRVAAPVRPAPPGAAGGDRPDPGTRGRARRPGVPAGCGQRGRPAR